MKYTRNALNILTIKSYKGIGNAWIVKNLKGGENEYQIVNLINNTIKGPKTSVNEFERLRRNFEDKIIEKLSEYCDGFVALGDPDFPQHRGNVKDSSRPVFLYYKGDIALLNIENKNITVIGLLNPDSNIETREKIIVDQFIKNGATIVSGLAMGCDSISHRQALESNGKTVAILPSPLNNIMPASNKLLANQIVEEGGLLVTEYGSNFKSQSELFSRYQERDRLQALFCDIIVLAASYALDSAKRWNLNEKKLDSGARLAMGYAFEYGIPRVVMYNDNIDNSNPMFDLNRKLINENNDIIILNEDNLHETIANIISINPKLKNKIKQNNLFDE
jgi:DNA processing protein